MPASPQQWSKPPGHLQLIPGTVDVWLFSLNQPSTQLDKMKKLLSSDELARAERIIQQSAGKQYIAAHGILRILLSRYLNKKPEEVVIKQDINGKPLLSDHLDIISEQATNPSLSTNGNEPTLNFNLSHSHETGLIAISADRAVGVDIEYLKREFEYLKIAKRFFSPTEYEVLQNTPGPLQKNAFFSGWCRKEAILKALGTGISGGLGDFDVSLSTEPHTEIIKLPEYLQAKASLTSNTNPRTKWCIQNLPVVDSYTHAVAAEGDDWVLRCFNW